MNYEEGHLTNEQLNTIESELSESATEQLKTILGQLVYTDWTKAIAFKIEGDKTAYINDEQMEFQANATLTKIYRKDENE